MSIQSHPTEAAAVADLEARGFCLVPPDLLPPSWRKDVSRYFWHHEQQAGAMLYQRGANWEACIGLPSDILSRILGRYAAAELASRASLASLRWC
jgi:hypothetical protein